MTRDGLIEVNETKETAERVSRREREADFSKQKEQPAPDMPQKKRQGLKPAAQEQPEPQAAKETAAQNAAELPPVSPDASPLPLASELPHRQDTATAEQLDHLVSWIEDRGFRTNVSQGDNETLVGIIGDTTRIDPFILESMDIVERVQRVSEPYKLANRKFHPEDTVVDCGYGVLVGGGHFQVIAGPCSVEGENLIQIDLINLSEHIL